MRIAFINRYPFKVGGAETYIENTLSALSQQGHVLSLWTELETPSSNAKLSLPKGVLWNVGLEGLDTWKPDVIFSSGVDSPEFEEQFLAIGQPTVRFLHDYYGTCISGTKTFSTPKPKPCSRRFGPACLVHYFPRRCGGLSPATMFKDYRDKNRRLARLSLYQGLVVASEHMALEFAKHGLTATVAPLWAETGHELAPSFYPLEDYINLLFVGRFETLKGGQLLLEALPMIHNVLQRSVFCHFVGSGRAKATWERHARRIMSQNPGVKVIFHGWQQKNEIDKIAAKMHLLVVPSVWPEPFGLVGLEMGLLGIPVIAFDVGGIKQWLKTGVNGVLASGSALDAQTLCGAILSSLADPALYKRLRFGALEVACQFTQKKHIEILESVFERAIQKNES